MSSKPEIYLALLRGINVGGKMKVNMADLKVCFEKLGYGNVQTYGNSGNVIFTAASTDRRQLESQLKNELKVVNSSFVDDLKAFTDQRHLLAGLPADECTFLHIIVP